MVDSGQYGAILADPPWAFRSWSDKGKNRAPDAMVGLAERHYKTIDLKSVRELDVRDLAARNCALFLWTVDCSLVDALEVGRAWGFKYKTVAFTWIKTGKNTPFPMGLGYWSRGNPEQCLLFTRGKPKRQSASVRQLIIAPRREHSRKPDEARTRIEQMVPGPYLELFARQRTPGWDAHGDQLDRFAAA